ncbi:hypothetical protein [Terrihabitans sp. B22-R8]|uniref:hypothetical protein n=1 Tax=Terrihabitans sp. B22-R8 TaxID=3425128 RepID=UPI00403D36EE
MRQIICIAIILAVSALCNAPLAARMASDGNWGEAVGQLVFAPLVVFYLVHSVIYYGTRLVRGRDALASYTNSKLSWIAFIVSVLGILGSAAQRVPPL